MNEKKSLAFYVELLLLLAAVLASGVVLVRVHSAARGMESSARDLTHSVRLAQNAAERFAAGQLRPSSAPLAQYDAQGGETTAEDAVYTLYLLPADGPQTGVEYAVVVVEKTKGTGRGEVYRLETARAAQSGSAGG